MLKNFFPPFPPSSPQAMAAKNITSRTAIFDPCTHRKKFFTPSTKKWYPCVLDIYATLKKIALVCCKSCLSYSGLLE